MSELKENIKKYLLIKHTEAKIREYNKRIAETLPWIWRKGIINNMETHCNVLLNSLLNQEKKQKYRQTKYIIDSILKYNIERSETILKSSKKIKNIKKFMQLNSYIIFEEISKGILEHKKKNAIDFNIRTQLSLIQEKINKASNVETVLDEILGVKEAA